ncbi:hypothetical protein [Dietzia aurantiaca]|nr:hypothetical protein [Dietzia aurantiaca]
MALGGEASQVGTPVVSAVRAPADGGNPAGVDVAAVDGETTC